ncbi:helix-turn-helix domain-containing protein [Clostridium akagii]|uniref:helix-turn-helix domain-containing protein n=1 Tax=Clostridium akagii TaxID=91623 RepID=UPI00047A90EC|nr:helix-turn-helix transcriptional regulator [Clostridium akagii]
MNGNILKSLRLQSNLTQEGLAKKIGVSASTIRMIEIGKRGGSSDVVNKIANFFNVSLDFLNGRSEEKNLNGKIKANLIDDFITSLIDEKIITDNNIDKETYDMIFDAVNAQIAFKLKKNKKGDK